MADSDWLKWWIGNVIGNCISGDQTPLSGNHKHDHHHHCCRCCSRLRLKLKEQTKILQEFSANWFQDVASSQALAGSKIWLVHRERCCSSQTKGQSGVAFSSVVADKIWNKVLAFYDMRWDTNTQAMICQMLEVDWCQFIKDVMRNLGFSFVWYISQDLVAFK